MRKRIFRTNGKRESLERGCERKVRAGGGDRCVDSNSRRLDSPRVHPDRIFIVIRQVAVRNIGVRKTLMGVAASVRLGMPVDNRVRVIRVSLVRVKHRRNASR